MFDSASTSSTLHKIIVTASLCLTLAGTARCQSQWQVHDGADQMSDERTLSATITNDVESKGRHGDMDVTAKCDLKTGAITLDFVYRSKFKAGAGFYLNQPDPTIFLGQIYSHKLLAQMRTRIGDGPVFPSPAPSDYPNQAALVFAPEFPPGDPAILTIWHSGGKVSELVSARSAKFEFTLENGDTPVFAMNPQDERFQKFAATCSRRGIYAAPPKPILGSRSSGTVYTAAKFIELLPDALQKAAVSDGLDPHAYDREIEYISSAIQRCARITPQMAADPSHPGQDISIWYKYGKQYSICTDVAPAGVDISEETGNPHHAKADPAHPRNGDVMLTIRQPIGQHYSDGKGFEVSLRVLGDPFIFNRVNIEQDH